MSLFLIPLIPLPIITIPAYPSLSVYSLIMSPITQSSENLTLAGAKIAVAAAEAKAREMGLGMNIAVVDASVCPVISSTPCCFPVYLSTQG
jgi:hypothetical protein